jgi:WD40 repeat protein
MYAHLRILAIGLTIYLSACAATPNINLKTGDMTMEITKTAPLITSAAFSPDGKQALSAHYDSTSRLWDLTTGSQLRSFLGHSTKLIIGDGLQIAFSPDGKHALSGGSGLVLWDLSTGKELKRFGNNRVVSMAVSPDGKYALTAGLSESTYFWNITTGEAIKEIKSGAVTVALSPDGRYALGGLREGITKLWDLSSGAELKTFRQGSFFTQIDALAFSSDGKHALSAGTDNIIYAWDLSTGQSVKTFAGHSGANGIWSLAFSPDNKYIVSGGSDNVRLWDFSTGTEIKILQGQSHMFNIPFVAFSPDGRHVLSARDASVRLWDMSTGEETVTMVGFEDGEWIVITQDGYYNSSPKGDQYLKITLSGKDYTVDQFYDVFYRPDIVAARLKGVDIKDLITITMQDAIKSPPPIVEIDPIQETNQQKIKICYHAKSIGGGIGEVRLFHNGKLIQSDGYYRDIARSSLEKQQLMAMNSKAIYENMRSVSVKGKTENSPISTTSKGEFYEDCKEIEAVSGENEVSLAAFNSGNTVQGYMKTVKFNATIKPEDPHLYILSIGIDRYMDSRVNLKYAAKDATDIEQKLSKQSAAVYKPQNIHYELLTDDKAGKGNIIKKINELSRIIKPNDGFVLFVAGHGVLLQNQYYMLTSDYDGNVSDASMISSNEIVEMSKKIRSLSQLFIFDTCHAGGVDAIVSGLYDARMSVLAKKMGLHIYASANSIEVAQDGYQGNGLFTYTLLDGLNNKKEADKNNDTAISIVELGEYTKQTTTDISKKNGHSQTPLIINYGKDYPVYNLR